MNNARLVSSLPDSSKRHFSSSNVMQEVLLHGMESHEQYDFQLKLWDGVIEAISISKQLSFLYVSSYNDQQSDADDLFNAYNKSKKKVHVFLEKFLNSFISNEYDDDQNTSSNIETHDQTHVTQEKIAHYEWHSRSSDGQLIVESKKILTEKPRYRSKSRSQEYMEPSENKLRPNNRIKYPPETEFRSKSRKFIRSPSNSRTPTKSRNVNWSSPNSHIPMQCEVRNRSRSKSQDQDVLETKSMHPPVKNRSQSGNLNRSPPNDRIQTQHGRRNRSRSRSYNGQQFDSRGTKSTRKRQPRIRVRPQSRSPDRRKHATKGQSLSKSKQYSSSSSSKKIKGERPQDKFQRPLKKLNKSKSSPLTESTFSSGTSQLKEEPPTPVINSNTMIPPQNAYPVPRPFYQNPHNAPAMFYPSPQCMPRLMAPPYYMPSRPRLAYPSTYPRVFYRPHWQPEAQNFDTQ